MRSGELTRQRGGLALWPGWVDGAGQVEVARRAVREVVVSLPQGVREVAEYHLGIGPWAAPVATGGGKGIRTALVLACARAVGGDGRSAVAGVVAVQLVHEFSLLHDDIMDGDRLRRHRAAAWVRFGVPAALLAGDALLAQAVAVVERTGSRRAMSILTRALDALMRGQSLDMTFERRHHVGLAEYRTMAEGKTGALIGAACALGAALSDGEDATVRGVERFGRRAGIAFQCTDDVLGLWGDPQHTGKPAGRDAARGKKTFPLLAALEAGGAAGRRVRELCAGNGPWTPQRVAVLARAVEEAGGRSATEQEAAVQLRRALEALEEARLPAAATAELAAMAKAMVHRHH